MSIVPQSDPHVVFLSDVDWETYEKLRATDRNRNLRMTYDDGDLEIMSPSRLHERIAELLALFIRIWAEEADIALQGCGSMTFKRKDLKKGFEPDKCFYIQHEADVRDRDELDFNFDPPPDLAIEVDIHSSSFARMPLYAAIRIPEIWRWKDELIEVHKLMTKGRYVLRNASRSLPGFPLEEAARLLGLRQQQDETSLARQFRAWVRKELSN